MEGSHKGSTIESETRHRVEHLFEILKREEEITIEDCLALAGFLIALVGIMTNTKLIRSLAASVYGVIDDANEHFPSILKFKLAEEDGVSHRTNVNRQDGKVPSNIIRDERNSDNIQDEKLKNDSPQSPPSLPVG